MMVVLTHAAFLTGAGSTAGLLGHLFARGDFGVSLFFALSGFLLYRLLGQQIEKSGAVSLTRYAARRFARVLPAYWVTLFTLVALTQVTTRDAVLHALAVHIYVPDSAISGFGQSWSVATELSFYVVLPFIVIAMARLRRRSAALPMRLLVAALIVTSLLGFVVGPAFIGVDTLLERLLPWRAPHFLVGMILAEAVISPEVGTSQRIRRRARDTGGCLAIAGAAYLASTTPLAGSLLLEPAYGAELVLRTGLATVFASGLLLPLALGGSSSWSRFLETPAMRWLGTVSYGLFLWHLAVFEGLFHITGATFFLGGMLPLLAVGLPVSLFLATISYHLIELPASRLAGRLTRRPRRRHRSDQDAPHGELQPLRTEPRRGDEGLSDASTSGQHTDHDDPPRIAQPQSESDADES